MFVKTFNILLRNVKPKCAIFYSNISGTQKLIIPNKLLKKKHKYQDHLYLNSPIGAEIIATNISKDIPTNSTFLEVNPGNGFLTSHLLNNDNIKKLFLFESIADFLPKFEELHSVYPDKVEVKYADFVNMWKMAFRDKCDNSSRLQDLLCCLPKTNFEDDPNMKVFACVGTSYFIKHLINSLVFDTSIYSLGRCEMFLVMPPELFAHLTCNKDAGYALYRATTVLFQIMFEYKYICKIAKEHFLPTIFENTTKKVTSKRKSKINLDNLYLVKVVPRKNLYHLCSHEDMTALWYFVKQNFVSRKNRVIPLMEKWAPGCGPRIIINTKKPVKVTKLFDDVDDSQLPLYSLPCTTMSAEDYHQSTDIFTQFGELSPSNLLTLFQQFRKWPEYKESPFLASLENSLIKMEQASEEIVESIQIADEDEISIQKTAL